MCGKTYLCSYLWCLGSWNSKEQQKCHWPIQPLCVRFEKASLPPGDSEALCPANGSLVQSPLHTVTLGGAESFRRKWVHCGHSRGHPRSCLWPLGLPLSELPSQDKGLWKRPSSVRDTDHDYHDPWSNLIRWERDLLYQMFLQLEWITGGHLVTAPDANHGHWASWLKGYRVTQV